MIAPFQSSTDDYNGGNLEGQFNELLQGKVLLDILLRGDSKISEKISFQIICFKMGGGICIVGLNPHLF